MSYIPSHIKEGVAWCLERSGANIHPDSLREQIAKAGEKNLVTASGRLLSANARNKLLNALVSDLDGFCPPKPNPDTYGSNSQVYLESDRVVKVHNTGYQNPLDMMNTYVDTYELLREYYGESIPDTCFRFERSRYTGERIIVSEQDYISGDDVFLRVQNGYRDSELIIDFLDKTEGMTGGHEVNPDILGPRNILVASGVSHLVMVDCVTVFTKEEIKEHPGYIEKAEEMVAASGLAQSCNDIFALPMQ